MGALTQLWRLLERRTMGSGPISQDGPDYLRLGEGGASPAS
jgi:hypothetical protein